MRWLYQTVVRFTLIALVLFPIWLRYFWMWIRMRRFGATYDDATWDRLHRRYAKRFYRLAVFLRGGLIKVGQIMSTRVDILPPGWTQPLAGLQDEVDPLPWSKIEARLDATYGRPLGQLFQDIDHESVAAASFGQVHRAITKDGVDVALKVKYPDVERKLAVDMFLFGIAVRLFNVFVPRLELLPIHLEVRRALTTELDYEQEARFTRIVHDNFRGREGIVIPRVIDELTTRDVICTTWFDGTKITKPSVLEDPRLDKKVLLERLLSTWIQMMYVDGVFQSDPHPGNLLVRVTDEGPILCVVDFGQVKILSREFHQKLVASVMAFAMGNVDMFVGSLIALGLFTEKDRDRMSPIVERLMTRLRERGTLRPDDAKELDVAKVREDVLATLDEMEDVAIPQELVLYGRTFALLAGVSRAIAPDDNAIAIAKPLVTQALLAGGPPAREDEARAS
ncbi:MAG: ABC1 kinase family protein [Sandaracinaceae bacterium]